MTTTSGSTRHIIDFLTTKCRTREHLEMFEILFKHNNTKIMRAIEMVKRNFVKNENICANVVALL